MQMIRIYAGPAAAPCARKGERERMRCPVRRLLAAFFAAVAVCAGGSGCSARQAQEEPSFRVVSSFYPIYIMALNVTDGVEGVQVENMAGQQAGCLHDYQLQTKDMRALEQADVFLINGAGMESFLTEAAERIPDLAIVDSGEGVPLIESATGEAHDHGGEEHSHEDCNPHIWVSVSNCILQVKNIARGLQEADPAHAAQYEENAERYVEKLEDLRACMHEAIDPLPHKKIVTFHEAFPYFAEEFGLEIVRVVNREPDSQPSARELAETIRLVEDAGVTAVFAEPQYPESAANIIAEESGIRVWLLDPVVTGPDDKDAYLDAMEQNLQVLEEALS